MLPLIGVVARRDAPAPGCSHSAGPGSPPPPRFCRRPSVPAGRQCRRTSPGHGVLVGEQAVIGAQLQQPTRAQMGPGVLTPVLLVNVDGKQVAMVVLQQGVDAGVSYDCRLGCEKVLAFSPAVRRRRLEPVGRGNGAWAAQRRGFSLRKLSIHLSMEILCRAREVEAASES